MLELIAKKIGMTHLFQESGNQTPVTIIKLYDNCVFDVVNDEGKEFTSVSIAFDKAENAKNITKPVAGKFIKKSLPIFKKLHNSRLNKDTQLKFGDALQLDSVVKKGDKIAEIIDNDPLIIERLSSELSAKSRKYNVAKIAGETAKIDYERQMELYKQGLVSKKDSENAKIQYKKLLSEAETAFGELKVMETKLARQETQIILAPNDGFIIKILSSNSSTIVKAGDKIATFAPTLTEMAIELYVDGNDIVLMKAGRKVRIQFEGIPAILFSGLPKMSVGTFGGVVKSVDQSISENGKFRVIVVKDENETWPNQMFLRHGTKVYGWGLLNKVSLGYELWRKLNNFPPIPFLL